ncbi:MAG TPA: hypothetical protein VHR72_01260, partial [Gemmataceae bacterium]|nr:hypothetical protein [Gemmataceae bacterium]
GAGHSTAPYFIGIGSAKKAATDQARRDLRARLAREADLVPCPKCNWINDELVAGYRLSYFRRLGPAALAVAIVGIAGSLLCGGLIYRGPANERFVVPYVLLGGSTIFLLLAGFLLQLQVWMRRRIQPNLHFPSAPKLPAGTPPALIVDAAGFLMPAARIPTDAKPAED